MPLDSLIPKIDDRRYDDIIAELRTRIARYTPDWTPVWTDVNDSDPGVTLAQVFAWLAEMMIYRLNKAPLLNHLKFLQLLGIELRPAEPAIAEVTFPVLDSCPAPYIVIPEHTQVSAESSGGEAPIIFETERSITALKASLTSVQIFDGYAYSDITGQNDEADEGFEPFGGEAFKDSALMLGFVCDKEFPPQLELNFMVWVLESTCNSSQSSFNCNLPETNAFPSAQIVWEYWGGKEWVAMSLLKDETLALTQSGHIYLKTPQKGELKLSSIGEIKEDRYWIRGRLSRSGYGKAPKLFAIRTNTTTVKQAETIMDEVLGGSDGSPNQEFKLANAPVLPGSLILEVDEGEGPESWNVVDDFSGSKVGDRHFMLNRTTGEVRFGDGLHGSIPVANVNNPRANVIARQYRFGGGKHGNVAAAKLRTLLTSISGVDENKVTNLRAAEGGRDEEALEEAELRATRSLKSKCRAVTEEDFEALAKESSNIMRAKALPLHHPKFPGVRVPGVVTVVVVPDSDKPNPVPSEGTLKTVCAYLNRRRLLTTELFVITPTYKKVKIEVGIIADDRAELAAVKENAEKAMLDYFHPLRGGEDNQGWPFGGDIYFSKVYQRLFTVAGVQRIERLVIEVDGEKAEECKDVQIPEGSLTYSTGHDVQVSYSL